MPLTVIKCSMPGCKEVAVSKVAAPWSYGNFRELKTYGFACPSHSDSVLAYALNRPKPTHFSPGETVGEIGVYQMGPV